MNPESEFTVTIEKGEDGWYTVECLELPGCLSQGKTKEEALENIKEAIQLYLEMAEKEHKPAEEIRKIEIKKVKIHA